MRIILSPAKQMRVNTDAFACSSFPVLMEKTEILMRWIQDLSYEEQKKLWACNDKMLYLYNINPLMIALLCSEALRPLQ